MLKESSSASLFSRLGHNSLHKCPTIPLEPSVVRTYSKQFGTVRGETDSPAHYRRRPHCLQTDRERFRDAMGCVHADWQGGRAYLTEP